MSLVTADEKPAEVWASMWESEVDLCDAGFEFPRSCLDVAKAQRAIRFS